MSEGLGKDTKLGMILNASAWETGAAEVCAANSGFLADEMPLADERPIESAVSLGQPRPSSYIQKAIDLAGEFKKKFRFGGKEHQLLAGSLGTVETVSYRDLTKIVSSSATGGSTITLVDSTAPFGADDLQIGKYLIINTGTGIYQVLPITDSTSDTLTFATATAPVSGDTYEVVDFAPAVFDICDGTATSTTIKRTTGGMTVNEHAGSWITITTGLGSGQTRGITSNTADTFTVDAAWVTTPDATSVMEVMDAACTHIYAIGSPNGIYFTMCTDIVPYIKEIPHLKIGGFTLEGTYDDFITLSFTVIGDQEVTPGVINTSSTGWTIREQENEVPMKKTTTSLLLNRASAAGLVAGTDDRKVSDFAFKFDQAIEGTLRTGPGGDNIKSEPLQNAHPIITLDFTEPLTDSSTLKDERLNNYPQKSSLTVTGAALNANQNRELIILMPKVALNEVSDPVNDGGFVETGVTTTLFDATSAPTGITYTDAFKIEMTDDYGGNPIQAGNT